MISHRPFDPAASTLVALLRGRAQAEPERRAYVFLQDGEIEAAHFTYAALDVRARAIAVQLQTRAAPGDRALLLYPPGLEFVTAFFGCLYAGVVAVPAYPPRNRGHLPRLQAMRADSGATLALTDAKTLAGIQGFIAGDPAWTTLELLASDAVAASASGGWRETVADSRALAFLQYTSGSTGAPKGVMVTHGNILYNAHYIQESFRLHRDSVSVSWLPSFHDMGLIDGVLGPVYTGYLGVLMSPVSFIQRPARWLEGITRFRATHCGGPNFGYDLCVQKIPPEARAALDLSSWESAYNGAEPVRAATLRAFTEAFAPCGFRARAHYPCYGMAETTLMVSGCDIAREPVVARVDRAALEQRRFELAPAAAPEADTFELVSSGRMILETRVAIVDPEKLAPAAPGAVGEIWVTGPTVCAGYWQRVPETAATFDARLVGDSTRWMRTGDLGYLDAAGELFICGRLKDMIIVRGLNHYPQDIELTVESCHPALRPACGAAFSVERNGQETLVVAQEVERTHLRKLAVDEVVAAIRKAVSDQHEVPVSAIVLLRTGTIPKTSSGKIMRRACRQQFLAAELELVGEWRAPETGPPAPAANDAVTPQLTLEAAVIETWISVRLAQKLGVPPAQIDPREPFSRHGLDSLAAVELSGALATWLGRSLSPTLIYDYPSIHALAAHLASVAAAAPVAQASLPASVAAGDDPESRNAIAIVGLGCRFPGAASPEEFWQLLAAGRDAISRVPAGRWDAATTDAPAWGGFLAHVDGFDADFFGVAPREADLMDPQQRLLLEVAYEALEDAGLVPQELAGSRTGVFVGISTNDYGRLLARVPAGTDAHAGTGNALSIAANRISYLLDLRGPSLVLDTACSSSLVAVHHAVRSLRAGESSLALVGGVNLILAPDLTTTFARAGMLAPDGRCKTFDASADGYVRGEGCGVIVLKRLADAQRDGDRVLAVVRGSAINQDGRSNGLTAPNGPAQQAVVRAALRDAGAAPADLGYVEAHGTGTTLGDPIEVNSLREVLLENRAATQPCWLGSVKTNIGHLEAAAGIAGLIKVVLALRHGTLPAHLHLRSVNPLIQLAGTPLAIPTAATAWPAAARLAGVSSFGFGGTNAHVIVGAAPALSDADLPTRPDHVLVLSARTAPALRELAARTAARLKTSAPADWAAFCHAAATRRAIFAHRLCVGPDAAAAALDTFARTGSAPGIRSGEAVEAPRVAFLFSDAETLSAAAARELHASQPAFRAALEECRALITANAGWDLVAVFDSGESLAPERTPVVRFAFAYALARTWQAWGVEPSAVVGHGAGEYPAAVIAGALTFVDALALLRARTRLLDTDPATETSLADFAAIVADTPLAVPTRTFISASTGAVVSRELARPDYWARQTHAPARLAEAMRTLHDTGATVLIEIGPRGAWPQLLETAAHAFVRGVPVRWSEVDRGFAFPRVDLPHYPFQRQRHWFESECSEWHGRDAHDPKDLSALAQDPSLSPDDRAALPRILAALQRSRERQRASDLLADATYEIQWPLQQRPTSPNAAPGRWLLLGTPNPAWRTAFSAAGQTLESSAEFRAGEWRGCVFLAGDETAEIESARLLRAIQTTGSVPLWIVTRGAIAISATEAQTLGLAHAPLWGMGKVFALEQAERARGLIDLSREPEPAELASLVSELLTPVAGEDQVVLRRVARHVARLERITLSATAPATPPAIRADATYWITGGTGALGLHVARWLAAAGARRLLLSARRAPSASAAEEIDRLRADGVEVTFAAVDVADAAEVARIVTRLGPTLRGIVHAAGAIGQEPLATLTPAALADMLRPKVAGAHALHAATQTQPLDFFVLFSSIASVWGAKGQAHYAAANHALDALAHHRRALGLPATSINWGPWTGGGMAGEAEQVMLARFGIAPLEPALALAALGRLLGSDRAQVTVARIDWHVFKQFFELRGPKPFLASIRAVATASPAAARADEVAALATVAPAERRALLEAYLQREVAIVLGFKDGRLPDPRQGFFALGMDSMMAVDLRNRLSAGFAQNLPSTLAFDHANIRLLAEHLASTVLGWNETGATPAATVSTPDSAQPPVDETDLDAALAARLAKLESLVRDA